MVGNASNVTTGDRGRYLYAEFERSWETVLRDQALDAFENPLLSFGVDRHLPEYAPRISSVCFVGFSLGYHLHYRDFLREHRQATGKATIPTVEETDAEVRREFDRVFFPYWYQNAYTTYVDALVPMVERPSKSREETFRGLCWLGFYAGYNRFAQVRTTRTGQPGWRERGQGLPPLDAEAQRELLASFEELWPIHLADHALNAYIAGMSAAQEDDTIERSDVLSQVCCGSFFAGAYHCYNGMRKPGDERRPQAQAAHEEWAKANTEQIWEKYWLDVVYPPVLETYMDAVGRTRSDSNHGPEGMLKQVCQVAFIQGYNLCFQTFMDQLMARQAEQQRPTSQSRPSGLKRWLGRS